MHRSLLFRDSGVSRAVLLRRGPRATPRVPASHALKRRLNLWDRLCSSGLVLIRRWRCFVSSSFIHLLCCVSVPLTLNKQGLTCKYLAFCVWASSKAAEEMNGGGGGYASTSATRINNKKRCIKMSIKKLYSRTYSFIVKGPPLITNLSFKCRTPKLPVWSFPPPVVD